MQFLNTIDMTGLLGDVATSGAIVVPGALKRSGLDRLLLEAKGFQWRKAINIVGKANVQQDYFVNTQFTEMSAFRQLAREFLPIGQAIRDIVAPAESGFRFTEMRVQRYDPGSSGISPHRDGSWCRVIIALFVLEGGGSFGLCKDRVGATPVEPRYLPMKAGDLVLMRAPGFLGENTAPMHFVESVRERRITFGLRYVP